MSCLVQMLVFSWLIHCLLILLSVAFFTLFERKVIGLFHLRIGPNKVSFVGLVQPLLDAFKLLSKQDIYPLRRNKLTYSVSPILALFLGLFMWIVIPLRFLSFSINFSILIFFLIGSAIVFPVLLSGWSSNSKYSLVGSLRSVAQSVSYESVFRTLVVLVRVLIFSFSIQSLLRASSPLLLFFFPVWFICSLAETHRAPFDFSEAESELVSGFNTEYSGAFFAFIFLSEYAVLLFSSMFMSYLFLGWALPGSSLYTLLLFTLVVSFLFIWVRITFCRFRYDFLMLIAWKLLLPVTLCIFVLRFPVLVI